MHEPMAASPSATFRDGIKIDRFDIVTFVNFETEHIYSIPIQHYLKNLLSCPNRTQLIIHPETLEINPIPEIDGFFPLVRLPDFAPLWSLTSNEQRIRYPPSSPRIRLLSQC